MVCSQFISNTKFLGLLRNSLSRKAHITQLTPKLCKACYVLRYIRPFMSQDTLKPVYYSYFHSLFKKLRILSLQSQYIYCLSLFVVNNKNLFHVNSEIRSFNSRQNSNLHRRQANLSLYQKGAYYSGIKFLVVSSPT